MTNFENALVDVLTRIDLKLDTLLRTAGAEYREERHMLQQLQALQAAVAAQTSVIDSATQLINGIPELVAAAVKNALPEVDPAALDAITAQVTAETSKLHDAIVANTPSAPAPAPAPVAPPEPDPTVTVEPEPAPAGSPAPEAPTT